MPAGKRKYYEQYRTRIDEHRDHGVIDEEDHGRITEFLDAKDPEVVIVDDPNDTGKSDGTLHTYATGLKRTAELLESRLVDATARDLNQLMRRLREGRVSGREVDGYDERIRGVKDEGLAKSTIGSNYQQTLRKFYRYHDNLLVDPDDIAIYEYGSTTVDERDVFDADDIKALRDACTNDRDRCFVDMLLYTGQRLSALLNLRLKDIDLDAGVFYLNEEAGELKGASGKRPLLYAESAVRDWLRSHPRPDDPEAHLITQRMNTGGHDYELGDALDYSTVHRLMKTLKDRSGVTKPVHPHNFRHTFVTIAIRDYGMDPDTVRRLIGHNAQSRVMERTYSHLTDDDVIADAEVATGIRDEDDASPLSPDYCENCGEPVPIDGARACPRCGIDFTPDSASVKETLRDDVFRAKGDAGGRTEEGLDVLWRLLNEHPDEVIQAVVESDDVDVSDVLDAE